MINQSKASMKKIESIDFDGPVTRESLVELGDALRTLVDYKVDSLITRFDATRDEEIMYLTLKKEVK